MAFQPVDFLELAKDLADNDSDQRQAAFRSAVSRGYYSVLLTIKQRVLDEGFDFPEFETHGKISKSLAGINRHANRIKNRLDTLRLRRNEADYNLSGRDYSAERINELVDKCEKLVTECRRADSRLFRRLGEELNPEPPDPRAFR